MRENTHSQNISVIYLGHEIPDIEVTIKFTSDFDLDGPSFEVEEVLVEQDEVVDIAGNVVWKRGDKIPELYWDSVDDWRDDYFSSLPGWGEASEREEEANYRDCIS